MAAGGGAWKVAYADFVTAMMAFFMVMWLTAQKPEVKEAVASYFRDPFSLDSGEAKGSGDHESQPKTPQFPRRFERPTQNQPPPELDSNASAEYRLDTTRFSILFSDVETKLTDEQRAQVIERAEFMSGKGLRVEIRGHCIRVPLPADGGIVDHWQLCYLRCMSVYRELVEHGIDPRQIRLSQAEGNEPVNDGLDAQQVAENSRVDVYLLPQRVRLVGAGQIAPVDESHDAAEHSPAASHAEPGHAEPGHAEPGHGESSDAASEHAPPEHAATEHPAPAAEHH